MKTNLYIKFNVARLRKYLTKCRIFTTFVKGIISLLKFGRVTSRLDGQIVELYIQLFLTELLNKGPESSIKLFKAYHRVLTCICLGIDFEPIPRRAVVKGTKVPKALKFLIPIAQGNIWDKRFVLTIANIYKIVNLKPSSDLTAITQPGETIEASTLSSFKEFVYKCPPFLINKLVINPKQAIQNLGYVTTKNGPNGPSIRNVHMDTVALLRDKPVLENVMGLLTITAPSLAQDLKIWIEKMTPILDTLNGFTAFHSRVSQLSEGGGKTRNIAIIDHWSQCALSFIHDKVMAQLKEIKVDATYSQEDGFKIVRSRALSSKVCFSYDLSSATDRFPIEFQKIVIKAIFGDQLGDLWAAVISDRSFSIKGQSIRWAVGQPLGALSSWGTFALTHHIFVRWCAQDPLFSNYVILGDDIAILDEVVALVYHARMTEIGVTINRTKGFESTDKNNIHGEFAKRVFRNGDELSGIPVDLILACSKSIYMIPDLLNFIMRRWEIKLPSPELYTPHCFPLSSKGKHFLKIVMSFRSSLEAKLTFGYPWCCVDSGGPSLFTRVRTEYLNNANEKIMQLMMKGFNITDLTKVIQKHITTSQGHHVSDVVTNIINAGAHPLVPLSVKVIGTFSMAQMDAMENLADLDKYLLEYLPDPYLRVFIYDRNTIRNTAIGKTALKFYFESIKSLKT